MSTPSSCSKSDPDAFRVEYSARRRRPALSIGEGECVVLHLPPGFPGGRIGAILADNLELVDKLRARYRRRAAQTAATPAEFAVGGRFRLLGMEYPVRFEPGAARFDGASFVVNAESPEAIRAQLAAIYRCQAEALIPARVAALAARHGIDYNQIKINAASSRWGSCGANGNLNFSWKLVLCSETVVDYVVAHELAHRREMNHSPAFWRTVGLLCPNYRVWRKLLRAEEVHCRIWNGH